MKKIKLNKFRSNKGLYALVDDEDYEFLNQWNWHANNPQNIYYALRYEGGKTIRMHRVIMKVTDPDILVDHRDIDGLNNQKGNLRICTNAENVRNRTAYGSSKYLGVSAHVARDAWKATIQTQGKRKYLGYFKTEIEAAIIYNIAARKYHGEFANPNIFT